MTETTRPKDATEEQIQAWKALDVLPFGTTVITPRGHRYTKRDWSPKQSGVVQRWVSQDNQQVLQAWDLPDGLEVEGSIALIAHMERWIRAEVQNSFEAGRLTGIEEVTKVGTWIRPIDFMTYGPSHGVDGKLVE
jgi:hypothetical protein